MSEIYQFHLGKCEHIKINAIGSVNFTNGKSVATATEAKDLGCLLDDDHQTKKEISKRIADTHVTWKKLEEFWKRGNDELTEKLIVYDAVIRTKLMYGIESLQLNQDQRDSHPHHVWTNGKRTKTHMEYRQNFPTNKRKNQHNGSQEQK